MRIFALAILASSIAAPGAAFARCTLLPVKKQSEATLVVYFTRFETEDKTGGKFKACKVVSAPEDGAQTFFVTPFRQDANTVVHKSNWPG